MNSIQKSIIKRVLQKCVKNNYCIEVQGYAGPNGYPLIYIKEIGGTGGSHRLMWFIYHGFIPEKKVVMHKCDNRRCINPRHLRLGTTAENISDMIAKNRHVKLPVGEKSFMSKFSDDQILKIRESADNGRSYKEIAKDFNIHSSHVSRIVRGLARITANGKIQVRMRRKCFSDNQASIIYKMRNDGNTWQFIADHVGLSRSAVMRAYNFKTKHPELLETK